MKRSAALAMGVGALLAGAPAGAQEWTSTDPVLQRIWREGMGSGSQVERLAQALTDSVGPRLTGSPEMANARQWAVSTYRNWGITAREEQYGTWRGWRRGYTHIDLMQPRMRTLEGTMLAWSPGTRGPVTAQVVLLPEAADSAAFRAALAGVRGKYVLISAAQPTCRPDENWVTWAQPATFERMKAQRTEMMAAWTRRLQATGSTARDLPKRLEEAGAAGILTNLWSQGWGVDKVFNARTEKIPTLDLSCEDYGLVFRMAQNNQSPTLRVDATSEFMGDVPAANVLAEIRGRQKPNEYVMLSAHFDSWDAGSGATDNATGTVVMMEAMRILRQVYPNPKRTILSGHWSGEEQGLNGSRGFVADNPRIVEGLQALFNQDNGTGRIAQVSMQGLTGVEPYFRRWFSRMPGLLVDSVRIDAPGLPSGGGSDNASFICAGAPGFGLGSLSWDYGTYTWHTTRDTYDKIAFDEVRRNATMVAMLVYLASEEPEKLPRARLAALPVDQQGQPRTWPACQQPARTAAQSTR
ncbi:MAG: M28 family peptidase [Gemmatimonadetes bacterium]|nr:M28 family peptidase [Gemmatimonadota bacterium]